MTTTNDYRIIVIDDERVPAPGTDYVEGPNIVVELHRSPSEGLAALREAHGAGSQIDELWLDHDMGFDDDGLLDIWPVVNWLEETAYAGTPLRVAHIYVHTANPVAAPRMVAALHRYYDVSINVLPLATG